MLYCQSGWIEWMDAGMNVLGLYPFGLLCYRCLEEAGLWWALATGSGNDWMDERSGWLVDGWTDRQWVDGWRADGWMDRWVDGRMDEIDFSLLDDQSSQFSLNMGYPVLNSGKSQVSQVELVTPPFFSSIAPCKTWPQTWSFCVFHSFLLDCICGIGPLSFQRLIITHRARIETDLAGGRWRVAFGVWIKMLLRVHAPCIRVPILGLSLSASAVVCS